ncbi:hypothetical protein BDK92_0009 [Micromonospora pisi]|uniref:Uncharacterized protein n=1 Tax=Micromonospora pisi TaxID=589240 RepID=A0A495J9U9_9ACTN|nr:hypothetical protein [Micromonospora pisi]RKR85800.1 hypothetical protein BDK92_0009 [Micromonospora pisi]
MTAQKSQAAGKAPAGEKSPPAEPEHRSDRVALATAVRDAVLAVDGVRELTTGGPVEVATQFAGGKVSGIRLGDEVEVHVMVDAVPIGPLGERVQAAVRAVLAGAGVDRPVEVVVDDIDLAALAAQPRR